VNRKITSALLTSSSASADGPRLVTTGIQQYLDIALTLFAYHVDYILDDNAPVMSEAFLQPARLNACRRSRTGPLLVNLVKPFPRSRITSNRTPRMVVDQACSPITRSRDAARTSSVAAFTLYKCESIMGLFLINREDQCRYGIRDQI
jgi:hypothetical protein